MSDTFVKVLPYSTDMAEPLKKTYLDTLLATEDNKAHRFDVSLFRDKAQLKLPSGAAVSAYFIRYSDNATITLEGTASGHVASVTLKKSCYNKSGQFAVIIKVTMDDVTSTIFYGEGTIFASVTDTILDEENVIPSLSDLLAQIAVMERATAAANTATSSANDATSHANNAADKIDGMTVSATESGEANAVISEVNGVKHIAFTLPKGDKGDKGDTGSIENLSINGKPVESGNITLTAEDVGARPKDWMPRAEDVGARPNTWMPSTDDVGALPKYAPAADASKLGGQEPGYYMPDYGRGEILWEGKWSSGNITVPNTGRYIGFKIGMSGQGSAVLAIKQSPHIRGVGGYSSETPKIVTYHFAATFVDDVWTFVACNNMSHTPSGSHSAISDNVVTSIIGLF